MENLYPQLTASLKRKGSGKQNLIIFEQKPTNYNTYPIVDNNSEPTRFNIIRKNLIGEPGESSARERVYRRGSLKLPRLE